MTEIEQLPANGLTVEMAEPLFQESWEKFDLHPYKYELNLPHLVSTWNQLSVPGFTVVWAAKDGKEVVGLLGALFFPDLFTGKLTAFEQFWVVKKSHRGRTSLRLWKAFEAEARRRGCEQISAGTNVGPSPEGMARMYRKMGFVLLAHEYRKLI